MNVIRFVATLLVGCGLGLLAVGSAGSAVPKPQPTFWSVARCERVVLEGRPLIRQVICVASGGRANCRWTRVRRARLYSEFTVFTRNRPAFPGADAEPLSPRPTVTGSRGSKAFSPRTSSSRIDREWPASARATHVPASCCGFASAP